MALRRVSGRAPRGLGPEHRRLDERPAATPSRWYPPSKRTIDVVVSGVGLVALLPVWLAFYLAIRLTTRGPAVIRQERVGRWREPFSMFKFRTMYQDACDTIHRAYVTAMFEGEAEPCSEAGVYKLVDDPRITPVGRVLRRFSLDELPQLFNVLLGQMSLVGPRPMLPWEAELLRPEDAVRFAVLPGITGLWQVSGRNALTMPQALALDRDYVARRSLRLDGMILLKTIPVIIAGQGTG